MVDTTLIHSHMPVVDCRGQLIGTVDDLDAGRIKLARSDSPDGQHHYLPLSEISSVDEDKVTSQLTRAEALRLMQEDANRGHTEA
jgi:hypothetical protein